MAGKARFAAAVTQCEHEALDHGGDVAEWLTEQIATGETVLGLADTFTRKTGIEISRNVLMRALRSLVPNLDAVLAGARADGAHALIETRHAAIEDLDGGSSKEEIAAERLKLTRDQWLAERMNKRDFGGKNEVNVNVNLGALHRDVIRLKSAEDAKRLMSGPSDDIVDAEIINEPEDLI